MIFEKNNQAIDDQAPSQQFIPEKNMPIQQHKELEQAKTQLQERDKTIEEYTSHLKRLQADFENFMKRTAKERSELQTIGAIRIIEKLLMILDDFERALCQTKDPETFKQGMQLVFNQFKKTLAEEGLAEIPATECLNPYKHEVMLQQPSIKPEGTILETLQKGYTFKDIVLRCAKVSIAVKSQEEENGKGKNHRN